MANANSYGGDSASSEILNRSTQDHTEQRSANGNHVGDTAADKSSRLRALNAEIRDQDDHAPARGVLGHALEDLLDIGLVVRLADMEGGGDSWSQITAAIDEVEYHILVMTKDKPAGDEPKLKAKAEDLLKQVRAGGDFAKLAKENSEDPGSKDKGGEYWVQKDGQMAWSSPIWVESGG